MDSAIVVVAEAEAAAVVTVLVIVVVLEVALAVSAKYIFPCVSHLFCPNSRYSPLYNI